MKFKLYGKVLDRSTRKIKKTDGTIYDMYEMTIEEPGQYPNTFRVGSKDASLFGQKDGPFAVGKMVTAEGFINGTLREAKDRNGKTFKASSVWFTISSLTSAEGPSNAPTGGVDEDGIADDIPF